MLSLSCVDTIAAFARRAVATTVAIIVAAAVISLVSILFLFLLGIDSYLGSTRNGLEDQGVRILGSFVGQPVGQMYLGILSLTLQDSSQDEQLVDKPLEMRIIQFGLLQSLLLMSLFIGSANVGCRRNLYQ